MSDDAIIQCAAKIRETCYTIMNTIGTQRTRSLLSVSEFVTLIIIREQQYLSISSLAKSLGEPISDVVKVSNNLEELGYITQIPSDSTPGDTILKINEDGHLALDSVCTEEMSNLCKILTDLKPGERSMVNLVMDLLKGAFAGGGLKPEEEILSSGGR